MAARKQIFVPNNPSAPRLCPELAAEIGLTESVLLLQLEFWIRTSTAERRDGEQWTYQSLADIQETFTFWSKETIRRGLTHLERLGLIRIGVFNRTEWDRTKWYALNLEGVARLQSIRLVDSDAIQADKVPISQNEKSISQNDYIEHNKMRNGTQQNETTIPETTTETTTENNHVSSFAQSQKKPKAAAPKNEKPKAKKDGPTGAEIHDYAVTMGKALGHNADNYAKEKWAHLQAQRAIEAKHELRMMKGCAHWMRLTSSAFCARQVIKIAQVVDHLLAFERELAAGNVPANIFDDDWAPPTPSQKGNGYGQSGKQPTGRSREPAKEWGAGLDNSASFVKAVNA